VSPYYLASQAVVAGIGVMVAEAPFVGWYHVKYPLQGSPAEGFYYVYTAALVRINPLSSRFS